MRTFIALELPNEIKQEIAPIVENYKRSFPSGINWVKEENLHITFQFIGDTKYEDIEEIAEYLASLFENIKTIKFYNPKLEIIPARDPKIIWLNLKTEDKRILNISRKLRIKLRNLNYKIDSRSLKYHITLGRIKKRLPENLTHKILTTELKFEEFQVTQLTLYKSLLKPSGPVYDEVLIINL